MRVCIISLRHSGGYRRLKFPAANTTVRTYVDIKFPAAKNDGGGPLEFGIEERHITEMCEIRPWESDGRNVCIMMMSRIFSRIGTRTIAMEQEWLYLDEIRLMFEFVRGECVHVTVVRKWFETRRKNGRLRHVTTDMWWRWLEKQPGGQSRK